jgi:biopolymer transport protein ExbD
MAEPQRRFLDVWIVESNTVYREVPYTVVTDWVQQGRLLDDDRLRPSGTPNWQRLGELPAFAAFLPKIDPNRVEDQAEALEPVQVDFAWKPRSDEEDDDVDMIPLIDISLVLLIFFMMTAAVGGASALIPTPPAKHTIMTADPTLIWIGVRPGPGGAPEFLVGEGNQASKPMTQQQAVAEVDRRLKEKDGVVNLNIKGHLDGPSGVVVELMADLQRHRISGKVEKIYAEVSEKVDQ